MKVGLKAAVLVNGLSGIARLLGYPLPSIPTEYMDVARKVVGGLSQKSSIEEFDLLQDRLDSMNHQTGEEVGDTREDARGAPLREFVRFLLEKDEKCTFSGLQRVATPSGGCCWTTRDGVTAIKEEERLEAERWDLKLDDNSLPNGVSLCEEAVIQSVPRPTATGSKLPQRALVKKIETEKRVVEVRKKPVPTPATRVSQSSIRK